MHAGLLSSTVGHLRMVHSCRFGMKHLGYKLRSSTIWVGHGCYGSQVAHIHYLGTRLCGMPQLWAVLVHAVQTSSDDVLRGLLVVVR
eukprot:12066859-Alexandrium_andersonii.AAC.1